jgi:hypothetical protein
LTTLLKRGTYSIVSAGRNPADPAEAALPEDHQKFADRHKALIADIQAMGYAYTAAEGHYDGREHSIVVYHNGAKPKGAARAAIVHHGGGGASDIILL